MLEKKQKIQLSLTDKIINLVEQARQGVARVANSAMVYTNYLIGKLIVEEYQQGETRAEYGANLLQNVSTKLSEKLGKGYSVQNLERMRNFFLIYSNSSTELRNSEVFQKSSNSLRKLETTEKSSNNLRKFSEEEIQFLPVSWSHYLFLIGIILCKNKNESLVEITLPEDKKQIFAAKYSTILPQKSELKALLEK